MKLIVLSLLLGGIASANGGTCKAKKLREGFEHLQSQGGEILDEAADIKAEVADLKAQVAEIKSLVEFIASEATEKPTADKCYDTPVTVLYPGSKTCPQS